MTSARRADAECCNECNNGLIRAGDPGADQVQIAQMGRAKRHPSSVIAEYGYQRRAAHPTHGRFVPAWALERGTPRGNRDLLYSFQQNEAAAHPGPG